MSYLNFSHNTINEYSLSLREKFSKGLPFPHILIENAFKEEILENILKEIPNLFEINNSNKINNPYEKKSATLRGDYKYGHYGKEFINYLNSSEFIDFLQIITSIKEPLVPDPHLIGGGIHQTKRGGLLKIHADFCRHPETKLDRRVNVLIYLNKFWRQNYGGDLELWSKDMKKCVRKIEPLYNRMLIFNTTDYSYHGLPNPLNCPPDTLRKSIAMYYYSNGRPSYELRPENYNESTLFKKRPGEEIFISVKNNEKLKKLIKKITPPILIDLFKKITLNN